MTLQAERHHWLNTIVGILDGAFYLSDEEQFQVAAIVRKLLTGLRIPERSTPADLPMPVVQEMHSGFYTIALESPRGAGVPRPVRAVTAADCIVSLEGWCNALVSLITTAYPDLEPVERLALTKSFSNLLAAIGVPNRAAAYMPDQVIVSYNEVDRAV